LHHRPHVARLGRAHLAARNRLRGPQDRAPAPPQPLASASP
jgi:hypothetical protein